MERVKERLENITAALKQVMICAEVPCESKYFAQLVGSSGQNGVANGGSGGHRSENHIAKLNKEFGVVVRLPTDGGSGGVGSPAGVVRIEGPPDAVHRAKAEFLELLKRLENMYNKDVLIEQKYHSNLIGKAGKNLNEIRAKFNDVQIHIPSAEEKSDVVRIRGAKSDVEKCFKHLQQFAKDMAESNYQEELQIVKVRLCFNSLTLQNRLKMSENF